jgi:hypothetical protein
VTASPSAPPDALALFASGATELPAVFHEYLAAGGELAAINVLLRHPVGGSARRPHRLDLAQLSPRLTAAAAAGIFNIPMCYHRSNITALGCRPALAAIIRSSSPCRGASAARACPLVHVHLRVLTYTYTHTTQLSHSCTCTYAYSRTRIHTRTPCDVCVAYRLHHSNCKSSYQCLCLFCLDLWGSLRHRTVTLGFIQIRSRPRCLTFPNLKPEILVQTDVSHTPTLSMLRVWSSCRQALLGSWLAAALYGCRVGDGPGYGVPS